MFGSGVLKGLGVTLKEFVATYIDDIKQVPSRYSGGKEVIDQSKVGEQHGLFTIQYPEERRKLPERFRNIPMLLYETNAETGTKEQRCTACGICAKVCPPQCIWIVRDKDENGKPITRPAEFHIDASICMNCGLCAEFCPFDAIKMNHDFEIAAYKRMPHLVFDLEELNVPVSYYARIRPTDYADEEAVRKAKESEKAAAKPAEKPAKPAAPAAAPAAVREAPAAPAPAAVTSEAVPVAPARRSPEEIERLKAEAAARRAAKAAGEAPPAAEAAPAPEPAAPPLPAPAVATGSKRSPEEIERLKAEAAARRAAKAAEGGKE